MEIIQTIIGFIFATIVGYMVCSFMCSPIANWFEVKIYYPKKYQKEYNKGNSILVFIVIPLFLIVIYELFFRFSHDIIFCIGCILGCLISIIKWTIHIKTPKAYMGIIKDEKDKEEYLELDKKLSQTHDFREQNKYKERQKEIFDKYLNK